MMTKGAVPVAMLRHAGTGTPAQPRSGARHTWTAVERERRRWARELHDETLQNLAGMLLRLSSARRRGGGEMLEAAVDDTVAALQQEISSLRSLIIDLRPTALDELGLEGAISALAQRAARNGLDVSLSVRLADRCSQRLELDTAVYRIVQEALTNAQKHGGAQRVGVDVLESDELIEVSIRDDGVGFDPRAATSGLGLVGMRERVELFGGMLSIYSSPGRGATVRVTLPGNEAAGAGPSDRAGRAA